MDSTDAISLDDFIDGMRGGCDTPGCTHAHGVMHLRSRCHPTAGNSVSVDSRSLVMRIACRQCDEDIVSIDLSEPDDETDASTLPTDHDPSAMPALGNLTPSRRLELAQVGHRAAQGIRDAMEGQEMALRTAVRGLSPHSDDAIEAMAIVLSAFVRVGVEEIPQGMTDDFVETVVYKSAESYGHMPPDAIAKLCERTKAMVREPAVTLGKPVDRPS
jgi:hypothetical protein